MLHQSVFLSLCLIPSYCTAVLRPQSQSFVQLSQWHSRQWLPYRARWAYTESSNCFEPQHPFAPWSSLARLICPHCNFATLMISYILKKTWKLLERYMTLEFYTTRVLEDIENLNPQERVEHPNFDNLSDHSSHQQVRRLTKVGHSRLRLCLRQTQVGPPYSTQENWEELTLMSASTWLRLWTQFKPISFQIIFIMWSCMRDLRETRASAVGPGSAVRCRATELPTTPGHCQCCIAFYRFIALLSHSSSATYIYL